MERGSGLAHVSHQCADVGADERNWHGVLQFDCRTR